MKKIYSLLLLGGLLLFGAQSAWADASWKINHNGKLTNTANWAYTDYMSYDSENGVFYMTFTSVTAGNVRLQVVENGTNVWYMTSGMIDRENSNVGVYSVDNCAAFYVPATTSITVYWTGSKLYVKATDYKNVTIYLGTSDRNLYAKYIDGSNKELYGPFPGFTSGVSETIGSTTYYKHTIGVPNGKTLLININDGGGSYTEGTNQTPDLKVGTITKDTTVTYNFGSGFLLWSIVGIDGDWSVQYFSPGGAAGTSVTIPLDANVTKSFQLRNTYDGGNSYHGLDGSTPTPMTSINSSSWTLDHTGEGNYCRVTTTIAGLYTFTLDEWTSNKPKISITYPDKIYRTTAAGSYGTICVPTDATIEGAELYTLESFVASTSITITKKPSNVDVLEAGVPYVYKATEDEQTITLGTDSYVDTPVTEGTNGLTGVYVGGDVPTGKYFLSGNKIYKSVSDCTIDANKAYFDINLDPTFAPSAIRIVESENNTTSIKDIEANEKAMKFFEDGKMYILRAGVVYDMTGRAVK